MSEHETPAETIRRAIEQMRADAEAVDFVVFSPEHASAVADLLEVTTDEVDLTPIERAALRLARTYLGETP